MSEDDFKKLIDTSNNLRQFRAPQGAVIGEKPASVQINVTVGFGPGVVLLRGLPEGVTEFAITTEVARAWAQLFFENAFLGDRLAAKQQEKGE